MPDFLKGNFHQLVQCHRTHFLYVLLLCGFEILCLVELELLAYRHRKTGAYTVASRMRFSIKRRGYSSPKAQKAPHFFDAFCVYG